MPTGPQTSLAGPCHPGPRVSCDTDSLCVLRRQRNTWDRSAEAWAVISAIGRRQPGKAVGGKAGVTPFAATVRREAEGPRPLASLNLSFSFP